MTNPTHVQQKDAGCAVEVKNLSMRFGQDTVVRDISVRFEAGKIHGIVGRNGSGKTVLMKCICGFLRPTAGQASVFGKVIGKDADFAPDTGMLIETPGFLPHETGMNNLLWLARLSGIRGRERVRECINLVGLNPALKKGVGKYSMGMRQRLGIAQALLEDPALLILDEPTNGLDKQGVADIRALLLRFRAQGKTIILASHNPLDIESLCDTVHEMDAGVMTAWTSRWQQGNSAALCLQQHRDRPADG
ncbi:MAG: ATP-binding cassette domain-containing protein [Clostridiales bacterium]|nr:ATP-binding cassette domain-containing protein [Clostridiales bacterium]